MLTASQITPGTAMPDDSWSIISIRGVGGIDALTVLPGHDVGIPAIDV